MKWMIASDLHGSAYYCRQLLDCFALEGAERLILLGDLLYHGPRNDLPRDYAPKEVISLLNGVKNRLFCVRGNCDTEVDQMVLDFPIMADYAIFPVEDRLMYVTHGHVFNLDNLPPIQPGDLLLHGHTHVPSWRPFGQQNVYLNPGSVSIPKEGNIPTYAILEDGIFIIKGFEGEIVELSTTGRLWRTWHHGLEPRSDPGEHPQGAAGLRPAADPGEPAPAAV